MIRYISKMMFLLILSAVLFGCAGMKVKTPENTIGIMSAMEVELEYLVSRLEGVNEIELLGNKYYTGQLEGHNVVLVNSGVGKSLSAGVTAVLITHFNVSSIIFTGIAGGVADNIKITDVVISETLMFHDYGVYGNDNKIAIGGFVKKIELNADSKLIEKAYNAAVAVRGKENVFKGLIATGDQFVANAQYVKYLSNKFGVLAVEMEGASVAYIASNAGIPFVVIRSMSDKADGLAHEDYGNWYKVVSDNSAKIVLKLLSSL